MKKNTALCILIFITGSIFAQNPQNPRYGLYIGGSGGLGPIMGIDDTVLGGNLNPIKLDWQMARFLSLGTGMGFYFGPQARHVAPKQTDPGSGINETYAGMETHMVFPLVLEAVSRPGIFSFELGGGLYAAPVLMNTTVERTSDNGYTVAESYGKNLFSAGHKNPFGFIASGSIGIKAGRGIIFTDVSYLRDFSELTVKFKEEEIGHHRWNILAFDIGFKFGIFPK